MTQNLKKIKNLVFEKYLKITLSKTLQNIILNKSLCLLIKFNTKNNFRLNILHILSKHYIFAKKLTTNINLIKTEPNYFKN